MKHQENDPLIREILPGDEFSEFRQRSLEGGLEAVRSRRKRRAVVRGSITYSLALVLGAGIIWATAHRLQSGDDSAARVTRTATTGTPKTSVTGQTKFITDDELLALFPNRAVALIGKPGQQELVFLDEPKEEGASERF